MVDERSGAWHILPTERRMPSRLLSSRFARFLAVGVAGFLVDAGISNLLVLTTHTSPLLSRVPAFLLATFVTFTANRHFTFRDSRTRYITGWVKYVSSTGFGAILNYLVFSFFITFVVHGSWAVILAIAAGSAVGLGFNYVCSVRLVFASA